MSVPRRLKVFTRLPKVQRNGIHLKTSPRQPQGLPSQGQSGMPQDQALHGRLERRLPIIVVVSLAQLEPNAVEWTYTDNISAQGARVFSKRSWSPGEEITVTPFREETTCGSVVYCQRLADGRYFLGVKFKDHQAPWSAIRRYDGIQISATVTPNASLLAFDTDTKK